LNPCFLDVLITVSVPPVCASYSTCVRRVTRVPHLLVLVVSRYCLLLVLLLLLLVVLVLHSNSCWCCYSCLCCSFVLVLLLSCVCVTQVCVFGKPPHSCSARVLVLDCSSWCDPQLMNDLLLVLMLLVLMALIGAHGAAPNNQCAAPTACAGALLTVLNILVLRSC
jgi:hypothetical protein